LPTYVTFTRGKTTFVISEVLSNFIPAISYPCEILSSQFSCASWTTNMPILPLYTAYKRDLLIWKIQQTVAFEDKERYVALSRNPFPLYVANFTFPAWYIHNTISFTSYHVAEASTFIYIYIWERITSNRLILFPTHTRNSVEWLQNFPPAEHRYSELPTISLQL